MTRPLAPDALSAAIARTTAALDSAGPRHAVSWRFTRCWLLETRFEDFGRSLADLDLAVTDFDALPAGTPGRERLAAVLVVAHVRASLMTDAARFERVRRLTEIANADPDPFPDWPPTAAVVKAFALMHAALGGAAAGFSTRAARDELEELAAVVGVVEPQATQVEMATFAIGALEFMHSRDIRSAESLAKRLPQLVERLARHGVSAPHIEYMTAIVEAFSALARYDVTVLANLIPTFARLKDQLPSPYREHVQSLLDQLEPMLRMFMPGGTWDPERWAPVTPSVPGTPAPPPLPAPDVSSARSPQEEAVLWHGAGLRELAAEPDSAARLSTAVDHFTRAVDVSPEHDPLRPVYVMRLGTALLARYEARPDEADLVAGTQRLEQARALAGVETHWVWTMCANPLAHAYRLSGRRDLGRQTALSGLRGHAWNALLQDRSSDVSTAVKGAANDGIDVARWCLSDGDAAGAAAALDAGRALILYAATRRRGLGSLLMELGEHELAREWTEASASGEARDVPASLRHRVVEAVTGVLESERAGLDRASVRLLDPPSLHEVRAALGALGVDVLIYLMPGDQGPGAAVIVPAQEPVGHILLPRLAAGEIERFDRGLAEVSRGLVGSRSADGPAHRDVMVGSRRTVESICEWAWEAAIGPLTERRLTMPADRPLRLVLIPMGELSRVPWHAARRKAGGRYEYALSRVSFSYAASARMLCEAAWRAPSAATANSTARALVVADPGTGGMAPDLPAARAEAQAIRQVFYPSAPYLGRTIDGSFTPDGPGTVAELTAWLAAPDGGSTVHLAVHGQARGGGDSEETSYLLLASEAGAPGQSGRLVAESLINVLGSVEDRDIDLAVLAGCRTGESTRGFDEAFSIGTALLASGVRTVISSQWSVPDSPTSILMFLFHHYLRSDGLEPVEALRQAQLAMIEGRPVPAAMPGRLRSHLVGDDLSDVLNWAAFFHAGR